MLLTNRSTFFKQTRALALPLLLFLSGCVSTSTQQIFGACDSDCVEQRNIIAEPRRVSQQAQGVIAGAVLGALVGIALSGRSNRTEAALIGGILGAGAGYNIGKNIASNRVEATKLAIELSKELRAQAENADGAGFALTNLSVERKRRIRSGQSALPIEARGFQEDIEIANATLSALKRQLNSSSEFERALSEDNIRVRSLVASLAQLEGRIEVYSSTIDRVKLSVEREIAQGGGCLSQNGKEDETGELDFPLPGCMPSRG